MDESFFVTVLPSRSPDAEPAAIAAAFDKIEAFIAEQRKKYVP